VDDQAIRLGYREGDRYLAAARTAGAETAAIPPRTQRVCYSGKTRQFKVVRTKKFSSRKRALSLQQKNKQTQIQPRVDLFN